MTDYWAKRGKAIIGPLPSRAAALEAFRAAYPYTGPEYMLSSRTLEILTGYGTAGPGFDMQWYPARRRDP